MAKVSHEDQCTRTMQNHSKRDVCQQAHATIL